MVPNGDSADPLHDLADNLARFVFGEVQRLAHQALVEGDTRVSEELNAVADALLELVSRIRATAS